MTLSGLTMATETFVSLIDGAVIKGILLEDIVIALQAAKSALLTISIL